MANKKTNQDERLPSPQVIQNTKATRYPGSGCYDAKTQEAAQADEYISVKLLDSEKNEIGTAFDAKCMFTDNATKATDCIPLVKTGKVVIVSKINDTWYIINPTFAYMPECI